MAQHRNGRSTDTRDRILAAAEQLYYAGGHEGVNLQVIADQLGVSKTAIFHHFKNKQELFFATMLAIAERHRLVFARVLNEDDPTAPARLRRMMLLLVRESSFDVMHFMREEFELLAPDQRAELNRVWQTGMLALVRRVFAEGVQRAELRPVDVSLATFAFLHLCLLLPRVGGPALTRAIAPGTPVPADMSPERAVDALLDLFLAGVGAPGAGGAAPTAGNDP